MDVLLISLKISSDLQTEVWCLGGSLAILSGSRLLRIQAFPATGTRGTTFSPLGEPRLEPIAQSLLLVPKMALQNREVGIQQLHFASQHNMKTVLAVQMGLLLVNEKGRLCMGTSLGELLGMPGKLSDGK